MSCSTGGPTPRNGSSRFAESVKKRDKAEVVEEAWREASVEQRLQHAMVHGIVDFIDADTEEARRKLLARSWSSKARSWPA